MKAAAATSNLLGVAVESKHVRELKERIEELEKTHKNTSELEKQIEELTALLAQSSGELEVELNLIDPNPHQIRQTWNDKIVDARVQSLQKFGQKTPVILIPKPDGRFEIFDGEVRWRAASKLGWQTLRSVFLPLENASTEEVLEQQIVVNLHAEKVNNLDLAISLQKLLAAKNPDLQDANLTSLARAALYQLQKSGIDWDSIEPSDTALSQIEDSSARSLLELCLKFQLNPYSIKSQVFPLLNLPVDLRQAIQQKGLDALKAQELGKLNEKNLKVEADVATTVREDAVTEAIDRALSFKEVKALVKSIINKYDPPAPKQEDLYQRLASALKRSKDLKVEQKPQAKKLLKAIEQIEKLLSEASIDV